MKEKKARRTQRNRQQKKLSAQMRLLQSKKSLHIKGNIQQNKQP